MKLFGLINIGVLPLLLEAMVPAHAQHEQREREAKRPNQEQSARPEKERQQARPARQEAPERSKRQEEPKRQQEARPERPQPRARPTRQEEQPRAREQREERPSNLRGQPKQQQREQPREQPREQQRPQQAKRPTPSVQRRREVEHRTVWQGHRAQNWQAEHRNWQDRGGYKGYRIPEARYRGHFGPEFGFRMFSFPLVVVGGFPRFQFGGFWFSVMDPWPEYWADDWYGNDDMYIDYWGGGYYLHNRRHPLDRIAVTVYLN